MPRHATQPRVRLVHWNQAEAAERAERLRGLGFQVNHAPILETGFAELREHPPDAVVIDLARLPMQGREIGVRLRQGKVTRTIPLVFVGGLPEKVARVRTLFPDASFCDWATLGDTLTEAIAKPPLAVVVPGSAMAAYTNTPLATKLGVRAGMNIALIDAPEGFSETLGDLPEGVRITQSAGAQAAMVLWFIRYAGELEESIVRMAPLAGRTGGLWIMWPKRASGTATDLSQRLLIDIGCAMGLSVGKVCSVDATWSAMRFSPARTGARA